ncbi:MAG: 1-aminocyclopropane-1-carboxylate deaminase [Waddliaceae bacterium]|nr:1-aminocyclopropane-1-carboxylate deaminase [Waddliaceae bacterium]
MKNLSSYLDTQYRLSSRAHSLKTFGEDVFVKRDDELGFGITGSKLRKFASLLPVLRQKAKELIVIGGAQSHNVCALSQLLLEEGIPFQLYLCEARQQAARGVGLIIRLLGKDRIRWISRQDWPKVECLAQEEAARRKSCLVIPEGSVCKESLPGALTLVQDFLKNEKELGKTFSSVLVDAGTGFSAAALALGLASLKHPAEVHVLCMAPGFEEMKERCSQYWNELFHEEAPKIEPICHRPNTAASFGAINSTVMKELARMIQEEGILTDPIYSTKLFLSAKSLLLPRPSLLIHSGGGLSLLGVQDRLISFLPPPQ